MYSSPSVKLLREQGVEAIMLGGTDLALVFADEKSNGFPLVDCAGIHVDTIVRLGLK